MAAKKRPTKRVNGRGSVYRRGGRPIWYIAWFGIDGKRHIEKTGTENKAIAEDILKKRQDEVAAVRGGTVDARTLKLAEQRRVPLQRHIDDYLRSCRLEGQVKQHRDTKRLHLERAVEFIRAAHLPGFVDLDAARRFLEHLELEGRSARTRNSHRQDLIALVSWLVAEDRWTENGFLRLPRAEEALDRRRERRAFTFDEIRSFIAVAKAQDEAGEKRRWSARAPVYVTAVLTGLRRKELRLLEWRDVDFENALLTVRPEIAKSKKVGHLPLHQDVVAALRTYRETPRPMPRARVFRTMPTARTFRLDLERAGLPRKDDAGLVLDFHSLRGTTATMLALLGTPPAVVRDIMRHAKIDTTLDYYTHLRSTEKVCAIERVPSLFASDDAQEAEAVGAEAAATQAATSRDQAGSDGKMREEVDVAAVSACDDVGDANFTETTHGDVTGRDTTTWEEGEVVGDEGLEPSTPSLSSWCSSQLS